MSQTSELVNLQIVELHLFADNIVRFENLDMKYVCVFVFVCLSLSHLSQLVAEKRQDESKIKLWYENENKYGNLKEVCFETKTEIWT